MDFPTLVSSAAMMSNAVTTFKNTRDLLKDTSNSELKESFGEAYEALLDLRERLLAQDEQLRSLQRELDERAKYVGPEAPHGYVYAAEDDVRKNPLCPTCYQSTPSKIGFMAAAEPMNGGVRRRCKLCQTYVIEEPFNYSQPHRTQNTPNGWMGR